MTRTSASLRVVVVEGARHYEMYDEPGYVAQAADRLAAFFTTRLGPPA